MNRFFNLFKYKSNIDPEVEFKFNIYNPKREGVIFGMLILVLPMLFVVIARIIFTYAPITFGENMTKEVVQNVAASVFQFVCTSIAMFLVYKSDRELFWKTSGFGIFLFTLAPVIFSLVLSSVIVFFITSASESTQTILNGFFSIASMMIVEVAIVFFMLRKVVDLKERIIQTFKKNWKSLIVIVAVGSLLVIGVSFLAGFIQGDSQTANQDSLVGLLNSSSKKVSITYAILLFFFTIIIAPFIEELTMRDSVFTNCGNKWLGLIISTLYFAMSHVYLAGDIENIWIYLVPSFIFSLTFLYTKGNVTYSWLIHVISNLVSYILIIVGTFN